MTISDEISIIANQLANQGITPSVALIKSKLSQPVPLPQIITTLKHWQHDPAFIQIDKSPAKIENVTTDTTILNNETVAFLIAEAIKPLELEIKALKVQIEKLVEQNKPM